MSPSSSVATFDEKAPGWDTPRRIARAEDAARAIEAAIRISRGCRAIEVGAGTGLLGLALRAQVGSLVLADASQGMLAEASRKIEEGHLDGVSVAQFDLASDPPPAGAPFDLVLSLLLLHHVRDTRAALKRMYQLLGAGGQLAAIDLDSEDGTFHSAGSEGVHHRGFDRDRLAALAAEAGFEDVRVAGGSGIDDGDRNYPMFLLTGRRP